MPMPGAQGEASAPKQVGRTNTERKDFVQPPLLIHLDVNKTVIPSDSMQLTGIEDGIRESVADLFWGSLRRPAEGGDGDEAAAPRWEWIKSRPSSARPFRLQECAADGEEVLTYGDFCRRTIKNKEERKTVLRNFTFLTGQPVKEEMERLVKSAMRKLVLRQDVCNSKEAEEAGITGNTLNMFPTLFHLAAALQRTGRPFALLFRSFGGDHMRVQQEWNAFCEMRHPIFSHLIEDIGPMDGSLPHVPDRRLHGIHTLYRDAEGPMLILNSFTNGPADATWDSWAKGKPKAEADTRQGREYVRSELKATTADGYSGISYFMENHLHSQGTAAIKDDWAWWMHHGETAEAGKLLMLFEGSNPSQQLFFDDNIGHDDARIVDCRRPDGASVPPALSLQGICQKVNPVEAVLDNNYFLRKLLSVPYQSLSGHPRPPPLLGSRPLSMRPSSERQQRPHNLRVTVTNRTLQGGALPKRPRYRRRSSSNAELVPAVGA